MFFIDSHVHLGQFYNQYTSPTELRNFLDSVGVERFAASSTTICEGDYEKVIAELNHSGLQVQRFLRYHGNEISYSNIHESSPLGMSR